MKITRKNYSLLVVLGLTVLVPQTHALTRMRMLPARIAQWTAQHKPWAWKSIEKSIHYPPKSTDFPPNFVWGVGTSSYQVDGNCTGSSYETWAKKHPSYKESAGIACDHWNRYKEDIALMRHQLGVSSYRFSVEWSRIEPQEGIFDQKALDHYAQVYRELIKNGIKPLIGFHHYSDPQWFLDKGGFENSKNIRLFVRFCTRVYQALNKEHAIARLPENLNPLWITFNSPASYAANGYLTGERPPGKKSIPAAITVLKNMLEAHVQVYLALKKHSTKSHIGITHNIYQLDPKNNYNPLQRIKAYFGNKLVHDCVYEFFTKGTLSYTNPFKVLWMRTNKNAPTSLDFIGLNYYCHGIVDNRQVAAAPYEIPTDNPRYTIYAEGMYRALEEICNKLAKPLNIPIYITENGIGTTDNTKRDLFLKRYLYAIAQAIKKGHNIMGYCHWSLMDNYEWNHGYSVCYGLYAIDRKTLTRTLRPSADYFIKIIRDHRLAYRNNSL